jgi:hypothetical protein
MNFYGNNHFKTLGQIAFTSPKASGMPQRATVTSIAMIGLSTALFLTALFLTAL